MTVAQHVGEQKIVEKSLQEIETLRGFVHIPTKGRDELFGDLPVPSVVTLNGSPARLDRYGRIWSPLLRRYAKGTQVRISKTENGFLIEPANNRERSVLINHEEKHALSPSDREATANNRLYFRAGSVFIYNDDILTTDVIENKSIDLIVTSPPYNVGIEYADYKDNIPYEEYLIFTRKWLAKCYDLVKNDGRLCLNIPLDKNKGGQQSVCADITTVAKEVGWKYHATVIWNEQNISRRTAWGSWLSASAPFVIAPVEVVVVLYRENWHKRSGSLKSDIARNEFISWTNGVWNFSGESKNKIGHPAPFPIELPRRCIKLFSFIGDTVLDPFLGSGTTLLACAETNRAGIGVEINKNYCEMAKKRLESSGIYQRKLTPEG
jgi:site-specific DNA-methyltransferase (adenine-specific)